MIKEIIEIYRIGKELGLSKNEISSLFVFKNSKNKMLSIMLIILILFLTITTLTVLIMFSYIQIDRNTYPTGAEYSTVRIKDFRLKASKDKKILNN